MYIFDLEDMQPIIALFYGFTLLFDLNSAIYKFSLREILDDVSS